MIKRIEDMNYYELLEVSPGANSTEIHRAYERVRRVYDPNSIALYSLFTPEETAVIHQRIEEAYRTLVYEANRKKYDAELGLSVPQQTQSLRSSPAGLHGYQAPAARPGVTLFSENRNALPPPQDEGPDPAAFKPVQDDISPVSAFIAEFTGPVIKVLREQRNLTIRNIADITKLSSRFIEFIEAENYQKLPARPYLRGFLVLYAKALGYEPERVVNDYLKRYDEATKPK
jgi:curved DNA-binding protein CbpA